MAQSPGQGRNVSRHLPVTTRHLPRQPVWHQLGTPVRRKARSGGHEHPRRGGELL